MKIQYNKALLEGKIITFNKASRKKKIKHINADPNY
jgi:hypothetical protein